MDHANDAEEHALRRAIQTLSQSDPLMKLLGQVRLGRMKPNDAGLRAVTESWLQTYRDILSSGSFNEADFRRLDPTPRLDILIEAGILPQDHAAVTELRSVYETRPAARAM